VRWLDQSLRDPADLAELLGPYPSHLMEAFEVSRFVNSTAHDGPGCIARI